MIKNRKRVCLVLVVVLLTVYPAIMGCGFKEDKQAEKESVPQATQTEHNVPKPSAAPTTAPPELSKVVPPDVIIEVEGVKLTRKRLNADVKKSMSLIGKEVPAEKRQLILNSIRQQVREDFINRTILEKEVKRQKIAATEQEVSEAINQLSSNLPPGTTLEEIMKKRQMSKKDVKDELELGIKINKLVLSQMKGKPKTTEKDISLFYKQNKDKFKMPETVRVRHILVAKQTGDDEKIKIEKKAKAENIRKQLIDGADFAELALKNSDCPSKQSGGDLGTFTRGQMVKPFEDAAFSQQKGEIGPVLETDFGYHIIQVLEHNDSKTMSLDQKTKDRIRTMLDQKKQRETFVEIMKDLRAKANIFIYEK